MAPDMRDERFEPYPVFSEHNAGCACKDCREDNPKSGI